MASRTEQLALFTVYIYCVLRRSLYKVRLSPTTMPSRMVDSARIWKFQRFSAAFFFSSSFNDASSIHLQYREYPWKWNNTRFPPLTDKTLEFISIDLSHQFLTVIRLRFLHRIPIPLTVSYRILRHSLPKETLFTSLRNVEPLSILPFLTLNHVLWHSSESSLDISTLGLWLAVCTAQPDRKRGEEFSSIHNVHTYIHTDTTECFAIGHLAVVLANLI